MVTDLVSIIGQSRSSSADSFSEEYMPLNKYQERLIS